MLPLLLLPLTAAVSAFGATTTQTNSSIQHFFSSSLLAFAISTTTSSHTAVLNWIILCFSVRGDPSESPHPHACSTSFWVYLLQSSAPSTDIWNPRTGVWDFNGALMRDASTFTKCVNTWKAPGYIVTELQVCKLMHNTWTTTTYWTSANLEALCRVWTPGWALNTWTFAKVWWFLDRSSTPGCLPNTQTFVKKKRQDTRTSAQHLGSSWTVCW